MISSLKIMANWLPLKDADPWADSTNLKSSSKMIFVTSYIVSKKFEKT